MDWLIPKIDGISENILTANKAGWGAVASAENEEPSPSSGVEIPGFWVGGVF